MRVRLPRLPIKTRIAVWISAISTALLVFMALAVYGVFAEQLLASLDQTVDLRSSSYEQLIDFSPDPPVLRSGVPDVDLGTGEAILRLYAGDGMLLQDASSSTPGSAGERELVAQVLTDGHAHVRTIDLSDNEDYRVLARPVGPSANQVVLISGLELSRVNGPIRLLRIILLIAVPVTAICAGLGGYWVATRALRPVAVMAMTARRITDGDLSHRVPTDNSGDELDQLATTFNTMIDRIDDTFRRERRFTADASHELRTPLAAIDATVDVTLSRRRGEAVYRAALLDVREQVNRLTKLTRQLLMLSRLDATRLGAEFARVDLDEVVDAVVESMKSGDRPIDVAVVSDRGVHLVRGDFELLARAFYNLLDNAAKHGGANVTVNIELRQHAGWHSVDVVDSGSGIPASLLPFVFDRFRRGAVVRTTSGAGLGLSIVAAIVGVHGGGVTARSSAPHGGTTISLQFPAVDIADESAGTAVPADSVVDGN